MAFFYISINVCCNYTGTGINIASMFMILSDIGTLYNLYYTYNLLVVVCVDIIFSVIHSNKIIASFFVLKYLVISFL